MFKPPGRNELEVVHERDGGSDDAEEDSSDGGNESGEEIEVPGTAVGKIIKQSA